MKAKISYTIDLTEVPNLVGELLDSRVLNEIGFWENTLDKIKSSLMGVDPEKAVFHLNMLMGDVANVHQTLGEMKNIVEGYREALKQNDEEV